MDEPSPGGSEQDPELNPKPDQVPVISAVETDAAVATEVVETPPVKVFVPEPPSGGRRVGGRLSTFIAVLGIAAIGGVAAFGYTRNQDLATMRATLSNTEEVLGATKTSLQGTSSDLDSKTQTLSAAKAERGSLDAKVADLAAQVSSQTSCLGLQTAALAELSRISQLQTNNNNRTAKGSTWANANSKRSSAAGDARDAYYQAYKKSFEGNLSSARAWAAKGKAAVGVVAAQAKQQLAEFGLIDRSAAEIEAAIDALELRLGTLETTCEAVN